jgi:hypothetical protein
MFEYLLSTEDDSPIFTASTQSFATSKISTTDSPVWNVQFGWYGQELFVRSVPYYGWWQGPILVCLTQPIDATTTPRIANNTLRVAKHPECGELLQACTVYGESCYWLGLGGSIFNVSLSFKWSLPQSPIVGGSWTMTESQNHCPISLDSSVYRQVVSDMVDDSSMDILAPPLLESSLYSTGVNYQHNSTIHALLITRLSMHTKSLIIDPTPLTDLGLLPDAQSNPSGLVEAQGFVWRLWPVLSFPYYQYTCSGLLIFWAIMLFFASWSHKWLLLAGTINQWVSFGADLGEIA